MALPTFATLKSENSSEITKISSFAPTAGAFIISLGVIVFIVWPKINAVLNLRVENSQQRAKLESLSIKVQKLQALSAQQESLEENLSAAEALIPSDKGVFSAISQLERAAAASGVLLNRVDVAPGPVEAEGLDAKKPAANANVPAAAQSTQTGQKVDTFASVPRVQIKISMTSDYKSFLQFLTNALAISRVVAIRDLSVASASDSSSQIRASMVVDAFWQPLPVDLSSVETAISDLTAQEQEVLSKVSQTGLSAEPAAGNVQFGRTDLFAPF